MPHKDTSTFSEWFEDWSDDQLALFIHSMRSYSMEPSLTASLSNAADLAGKLAEGELAQREAEYECIQAEIYAEIDVRREYDAMLAALPNDLTDFSGDEAPF